MKVPTFAMKEIGTDYLPSHPEEDNGFDYEKHEDWLVLPNKVYLDAGLVKIDDLIQKLVELNSKGANYVSCDWNCDHQELEIIGVEFRPATEVEILEHEKGLAEKDKKQAQDEILRLEKRLKELKQNL